ncbi:hypothetical protein [Leptospira kirschneri]|uniref:hypothetical protein n=1 Tax=Leptospira kirschneri TaxID=29507 RepID=UPI002118500F|nr:hypothetical protein [Leptospira kirschneri]
MKTSFAKTFIDLSNNQESKDVIFPEEVTKRIIKDENGADIGKENVFVIEPYKETYKSDKVSTLLVNSHLKTEYEAINISLDQKKTTLINALKPLTGLKNGLEELIIKSITNVDSDLFKVLARVKIEVLDCGEPEFKDIIYKNIFNDKTEKFLQSLSVGEELKEYILKYDELLSRSKYFKSGVFNHTNASTIAKNLKDNGFFKANHSVNFISKEERSEIKTEKQLEEIIESEKQEILNNKELLNIFNELDKKITANAELKEFRDYLHEHREILPELTNIKGFKEKLWISYFVSIKETYKALVDEYEAGKSKIEDIIKQARAESTTWSEVIDIFNQRFTVPFKLSVGNQDQVILKSTAPVVQFEFIRSNASRAVKEDDLMEVLSTGEKRALYLLNIIFEVEARKSANTKTVYIIDDIADSFDYKNKYAIIEYLKDISNHGEFFQIILSHNYDFFRTVSSRLDMGRENKLNTDKDENEIRIFKEHYQNNPFETWKKNLHTDEAMLISAIPFVRNLAEYSGETAIFEKLTSLLHFKSDTLSYSIGDLELILKSVLKDISKVTLSNPTMRVVDLFFKVSDEIISKNNEVLNLEFKVVLSIAIRLKAEMFIVKKISNDNFWKSIKTNQFYALLDRFKKDFDFEYKNVQILEQVNLMTPENIHINSFMYEPILDMANNHLKKLYSDVKALN